MKTSLCVVCLLVTAMVGWRAQQPEPPAPVSGLLNAPGQPTDPPPGWTLTDADGPTTASPSAVQRRGPGVQIHAPAPLPLFRPRFRLSGDGSVSALFIVPDTAPARYGLTLGGAQGLAFLVRADGTVGVGSLKTGAAADVKWAATAAQAPSQGTPHQLEVRVHGTIVDVAMNGTVQTTTTIVAGALDGVPGVYTEGGDVVVAGFTVKTARVLPPGGGGR